MKKSAGSAPTLGVGKSSPRRRRSIMGSHSRSDRRRFLKFSGALASFVVGAGRSVRGQTTAPQAPPRDNLAYGQPSPFDNTIRKTTGQPTAISDTALMTPLQDLDGIITPSGVH